ncbi:protein gurken isoform X1 [Drosophila navojoa]|nr:protein gurken isoform X1 [Drosophila navojoa]
MFYFYFAVNYIQQAQLESVVVVVLLCVRCRCVICFCFCCDAKLHLRPIRRSILKHDISDTTATATATVKRTPCFLTRNQLLESRIRSVRLPIMQIQCMPIFQVIFVLSTIVAVTDCCSSRILLLRQQTLQIEEHVVQLVNQLELQQQLNLDGQPSATDIFADTAQMLQVSSALDIDGELATIATTERDSNTGIASWFHDEETTTTTTTTATKTTMPITTTSSAAISSTTVSTTVNTMATGEPPPDERTPQLATDATISEAGETLQTTTTNKRTEATTAEAETATTGTAEATTTMTTTNSEDLSFKLPCSNTYMKYFCLNGGNCFRWAESENGFSYCVCAVGFVGERCDSKTENGVYVPLRPSTPEPQLKTAHIVFSFPMLMLLSTIYVLFGAMFVLRNVSAQRRKQQQLHLHKQRFFVSC